MKPAVERMAVCGVAVVGLILFCSEAQAGYWTVPSGTVPSGHFTYDDGHDVGGSFGDPIISTTSQGYDKFTFRQAVLGVSSQNGIASDLDAAVLFNIHMLNGNGIQSMEVRAYGTYLVQGVGSTVDLDATVNLTEFAAQPGQSSPRFWQDALTPNPISFPLTCTGPTLQGSWNGVATAIIPAVMPGADDDMHVSAENILHALSSVDGVANLNLTFQQLTLEITFIPEPATFALLAIGGLALLRRR